MENMIITVGEYKIIHFNIAGLKPYYLLRFRDRLVPVMSCEDIEPILARLHALMMYVIGNGDE